MPNFSHEAKEYPKDYSSDWENEAHAQRGEFLERFPPKRLSSLSLKNYAIGQNERNTFCYWVEPGTRKWAGIVGATADKFGIYYGKTKSDAIVRYRYTKKFSIGLPTRGAEHAAFRQVRSALVSLVRHGTVLAFDQIDANPLSQMFKAKILSLYFPEKYLPICSADRLRDLAGELGLDDASLCKIQYEALATRGSSAGVSKWSTLKYTAFLYEKILQQRRPYISQQLKNRKGKSSNHREVDFEKLMRGWRELGKRSEDYALAFERSRLRSAGMIKLARNIEDRTMRPGFGYDFESFSSPNERRYIEVKTLTHISDVESRFFVSKHERHTSDKAAIKANYFFYLVIYNSQRDPVDVKVVRASELYKRAKLEAQNYLVRVPRP